MKKVADELAAWLQANELNPRDFRIRIEAKTIAAQRDLNALFASDIKPQMTPAQAGHLKPTLADLEIAIEGPLPHFQH